MFRFVADDAQAARAWFESPAAAVWQAHETALLADVLPGLTGYRCIYIGVPSLARQTCDCVGTLRLWRADICAGEGVDVRIDGQNLPWASGSIDALILAHALELSAEPHALIRECTRVLSPRGQLVNLAFNPLSPWARSQGLRRSAHRFAPRSVPPRAARLADWLRLLDFETTACWRYGPGFPLFGRCWQAHVDTRWLAPLAWAAPAYALIARRRALWRIPPSVRRVLARRRERGLASSPAAGLPSRP
ncbi:methyltransferase domain-containing protein [Salinisphaera sp.]|uniref:methyltransferase domain-containing protein n=1 Tax=Salinisphaera sp. TaxID=1914330 RepID=UPI002D76612F|nr:methyltransferase domain-containing protein [Salinisphaera sp.]HET7313753.1 methyltransferase domain-containing protein [Salinisphaera sp.]